MNEEELAKKYLSCAKKLESFYKKNIQQDFISKNDKIDTKIFEVAQLWYYQDYQPWRNLKQGKELEELKNIIMCKDNSLLIYIRAYEANYEYLIDRAILEYEKYSKQNDIIDIKDSNYFLLSTLFSSVSNGKIDEGIFSSETLELIEIMREWEPTVQKMENLVITKGNIENEL